MTVFVFNPVTNKVKALAAGVGISIDDSGSTVVLAAAGAGAIVAVADAVAQAAAIAATTLLAVTVAGLYRLNWYAKVTQAATTSSTLGLLSATWTDAQDSVAQSNNLGTAGGNNTTTYIQGSAILNAKAGTNIQFAMAYASSGGTPMQYELHLRLEYLG